VISFVTKFKKWAWLIILGLAIIVGIVLYIFGRRGKKVDGEPVTDFVEKARTKLTELELREQIELHNATIEHEKFVAAVDEAKKIKNGKERRARLAELLKESRL